MVLIAISWIYISFTTVNLGFAFDKILRLKTSDFVILSFHGLLATTILGSIWAIFGRINFEFHLALLTVNVTAFWSYRFEVISVYKDFWKTISNLQKKIKILLVVITSLIIAQCAALPFIIDNETYYVQTIKWLNEYGFVKGLANLHIFLGQTSGWHITQSIFNFSFLYENFNDLSGFCLLLGNIYAFIKLNDYFKNGNKLWLAIGFFPIYNALLFQFISAPSPDMAIYVISLILFFQFIDNFDNPKPEIINTLFVLCFFLLYIKPTSVVILLIPMIFIFGNYRKHVSRWLAVTFVGFIIFALFIIKNTIITGYPLYPTQLISALNTDFAVPKELINYYFTEAKLYGFFLTGTEFHSMTNSEIFIKWLTVSKINGAFNILSLLLIMIVPIFIYRFYNKKSLWILYFIMITQLVLLLITSPQFRFFLNFIIFFGSFILACLLITKKNSIACISLSTVIVAILVFFPVNISVLTQNKLFTSTRNFHFANLIFPAENSNLHVYISQKTGNMQYYSPDKNAYFWYGGNGKLPCVNKQQLDYFEMYFHFVPQQRSTDLKDGFYSKFSGYDQ